MNSAESPKSVPPTVVHVRPLASPLPLGFAGLACGTFMLAGLQLEWAPAVEGPAVGLVLLGFVFPLQFTAAVIGFLCRDGATATAMGVLSGAWLSLGLVTETSAPGSTSKAAGLLLLLTGVVLLVPVAAAGRGKPVASFVIALASVRFLTTGVYEVSGSSTWKTAAGIIGLVLAAAAVYAALALALEDQRGRAVLPTWRKGTGAKAFKGDWPTQIASVSAEAGVRRQL
ncbi:GPR1/FUN34/YaaH family transporter [Streptomyces pratensis]|uniref:GPR1/FUN34/YaaH family transporter n=1 Tax=Streptomyces pratensis TaxID=1169025 RepID=UPI003015C058